MALLDTQPHDDPVTKTDDTNSGTKQDNDIEKVKEEKPATLDLGDQVANHNNETHVAKNNNSDSTNVSLSIQIQCINTTNDWDNSDFIGGDPSVKFNRSQDKIVLVRPKTDQEKSNDKKTMMWTVLAALVPIVLLLLVALPMILHESKWKIIRFSVRHRVQKTRISCV